MGGDISKYTELFYAFGWRDVACPAGHMSRPTLWHETLEFGERASRPRHSDLQTTQRVVETAKKPLTIWVSPNPPFENHTCTPILHHFSSIKTKSRRLSSKKVHIPID